MTTLTSQARAQRGGQGQAITKLIPGYFQAPTIPEMIDPSAGAAMTKPHRLEQKFTLQSEAMWDCCTAAKGSTEGPLPLPAPGDSQCPWLVAASFQSVSGALTLLLKALTIGFMSSAKNNPISKKGPFTDPDLST